VKAAIACGASDREGWIAPSAKAGNEAIGRGDRHRVELGHDCLVGLKDPSPQLFCSFGGESPSPCQITIERHQNHYSFSVEIRNFA
jgi:hypothetical protein